MANQDFQFVSSSKYDIYSKLLNVAQKYTDVENTDYIRTGLFGYITESMAMIARDSSYHKTMLYNESFLNTAVMPKTVYNWAKMFNINITAATPAYADLVVTIATDNIEAFSTNANTRPDRDKFKEDLALLQSTKVLIMDRDNPFIAGTFKFTLEKSVFIYKSKENSNAYTVKYCSTEDISTGYQQLETLYIKNSIQRIDGQEYLQFVIRVYQYEKVVLTKQITSSSFLNTKIHKFEFVDQYAGAKLFYSKGGVKEPVELRYTNIGDETDSTIKFAYYNLIDQDTLQITFSSLAGDFIPSANSILELELYTTKGSNGNITFSGDVIYRFNDEAARNLPVLVNFATNLSIGGIDSPSINKIKNTIINEISTRDVIVTETDLNKYFQTLTSLLETINDGKITFIKKRDDILRRVFGSYILMRDGLDNNGQDVTSGYTSKTIPTNTLSADFLISNNVSKQFGSIIKRKPGTLEDYEYVPFNALDGSDDYYIIPFYTRITLSPFKKVKYVYNLADDSTSLSYGKINNTSSTRYMIPSTVTVKRGFEGIVIQPFYKVRFNFTTNFDLATELNGSPNDQFLLAFYRKGNENTPIGTLPYSKSGNLISAYSDPIEEEDGIFNSYLEFTVNVVNDTTEFDFSKEKAGIDYGTLINLRDGNLSLPEDIKLELTLNNVFSDSFNMSFKSDEFLGLFRNLDDLMFSDISVKSENGFISSVRIKDIPVVHQSFFESEESTGKFINQLFVYIDMLKSNLGRLETNTFFDLKFYNTYGESQYYNTLRTDLDLELDVYVNAYSEELQGRIQEFVRILIDRSNEENSIRISQIMKDLTEEFEGDIDHIEFKGLNGTFSQHIRRKSSSSLMLSAPEHFQIPLEKLQSGIRVLSVEEND
jgi:hypothetical protein